MEKILLIVHVLACAALIGLILLQQGKGAAMGASFGGGASSTVFGSQGSGSFLFKLTSGIAAIFFVTSLTLGYLALVRSRDNNGQHLTFQVPSSITHSVKHKLTVDKTEASPSKQPASHSD